MEISPEERPVPALAHCLASASGFCGFCAIWDAKTIMVYHYRCKIIFFFMVSVYHYHGKTIMVYHQGKATIIMFVASI